MSFAGRRMKRGRAGTCFHRGNMVRTLFRLSPSFNDSWEGQSADPEEKQGLAKDIKCPWERKLESD